MDEKLIDTSTAYGKKLAEASRYAQGLNVVANSVEPTMSEAAMRKVLEQPVLLH